MQHPPPPRHWLWFATIVGLALLATLALASGPDPPALRALSLAPNDAPASAALPAFEPSPGCGDHHRRLCEHIPN
ncbi:MAG: hypothetical protein ABI433_04735 [Burkholderiaceae bacterium]